MASHGVPRTAAGNVEKSEKAKAKERQAIERYQSLERDVRERITAKDYSNDTLQATSALLQQNPEYYTIWNFRRLILLDVISHAVSPDGQQEVDSADVVNAQKAGLTLPQHETLLLIKEDLQFLIPLLRQYPKCYWIWNHRSWLLETATKQLPASTVAKLWEGELGLVSKMLALDSRNFHGWGYRRITVQAIERLTGTSMVESEFAYTTKMIDTNLSNFSAWHHRSQLIPRMLRERGCNSVDRQSFLDAEFELITRALYTDESDQSLWFYHQYLMTTLDPQTPIASSILDPCTNSERVKYFEQELENVRTMLDGAEDCKYIYQALLAISLSYMELRTEKAVVSNHDMQFWLQELQRIDPLRKGRWDDLQTKINAAGGT